MTTTVLDLPGVRVGARAYLFLEGEDEAIVSRLEDCNANLITLMVPHEVDVRDGLQVGDPVELEVPLEPGALHMDGTVVERRIDVVPLAIVRVEMVAVDEEGNDSREPRKHFRQPIALPLQNLLIAPLGEHGWEEACGVVRDLGGGGAAILCDTRLTVGAIVILEFPVPLEGLGLQVAGAVVGCREIGTGRQVRYLLNVSFENVGESDRNWLMLQMHRYGAIRRGRGR